ncbi:uncharacterized protein LOC131234648 [Magnolia sinica]|uniref:uncharacterized protein LOC131234648 n=1 Tax=Magnolia sinica TaxID=86752 RepID=UPI00265987EE|nr:uncharacterized protein LOC131234648 [Magnolia sinica]
MSMSMVTSISSNIHFLNLPRHRSHPSIHNSSPSLEISKLKHGYLSLANRSAQTGRIRRGIRSELHAIMDDNLLSGAPQLPHIFPDWASWVLGSIFTIIIPLWKLKGGFLQKLGSKVEEAVDVVDDVVEAVEDVVEVVEDVAEAVEKASSDMADNLSNGGMLRDAVLWVENASKELREDAQEALEFIDKVDDLTEEVEKKVDALFDSLKEDEGEAIEKEAKVETVVGQTITENVKVVENAAPVKQEAQVRQS